jgi:hypothetical protein
MIQDRIRPLRLVQRLSAHQYCATLNPRTFFFYGLVHQRSFSAGHGYRDDTRGSNVTKLPQATSPAKPPTLLAREKGPKTPDEQRIKSGGLLNETVVSTAQQRKADWAIIKEMSQYIWPKVKKEHQLWLFCGSANSSIE